MDATAGIAIGSRRGLGRVKHTDTVCLWVQAMVTEGKISLGKTPTKEMLADFFNETRRRCNDAELRDWIGIESSIRREQADVESLKT